MHKLIYHETHVECTACRTLWYGKTTPEAIAKRPCESKGHSSILYTVKMDGSGWDVLSSLTGEAEGISSSSIVWGPDRRKPDYFYPTADSTTDNGTALLDAWSKEIGDDHE